ncbi:MAG: DUF4178 domain-containing protein [Candidatus Latescibacterota bacterium]
MVGFRRWFGKKEEDEGPSYREYTLATMEVGCLVDYDLKTWQVTGYNTYDYDGYITREWELRAGSEVRFLECEEDDGEASWTLTGKIELEQIEEPVAQTIARQDDPPEEIHFEGVTYRAGDSSSGLMYEGGQGEGRYFVVWGYEGEEDRVLFITQWGEHDFAAYAGEFVEEYQFTDILPRSGE